MRAIAASMPIFLKWIVAQLGHTSKLGSTCDPYAYFGLIELSSISMIDTTCLAHHYDLPERQFMMSHMAKQLGLASWQKQHKLHSQVTLASHMDIERHMAC